MGAGFVAQIFTLPYRRIVFGRASDRSHAWASPNASQSATLRYSRVQLCATISAKQIRARARRTAAFGHFESAEVSLLSPFSRHTVAHFVGTDRVRVKCSIR